MDKQPTTTHHVMALTPKSADDVTAVHLAYHAQCLSVGRLLSIAEARELSLALAKAADEAELKLP